MQLSLEAGFGPVTYIGKKKKKTGVEYVVSGVYEPPRREGAVN